MSGQVRALRPGILVSIKTRQAGNRQYEKKEIEPAHLTEGGVERARWDTTRIVFDPVEAKDASQIANRARYLVTRLCADTSHGPICPTDKREELFAAIEEARTLVADFNATATFTRVDVNVICGEIIADDVQATRALFAETEQFMEQMQQGLKELDVKKVRKAAAAVLDIGQMLSPEVSATAAVAVKAARSAARKIAAAGERVVMEIDRNAIETIGLARSAFLDFNIEDVEIETAAPAGRVLDFEPEEELVDAV